MKLIAFDYYDKDRSKPVKMSLKEKYIKKNKIFKRDDVSYKVTKIFFMKLGAKKIRTKCIEIRMVAYKIANTVTNFGHKCPAKKGSMDKMVQEGHKILVSKYGKKTIDAWKKGRVTMKFGHLASICPECECVFWKEKDEKPEPFIITDISGKKKLIKRK